MELAVKTLEGKDAGKAKLEDGIFGVAEIRGDILHRMVRWQLAKRQAGTHKTQTRSEVSVTTKKFIRQKGSGGARHGARNAPIFVGGGVAHGPKVRSHAHGMPKRLRKLALAHALSAKAKDGSLIVLDDAKMDKPGTKDLRGKLEALGLTNALIIGGQEVDANFAKSAANIPNVDVLPFAGLNVYDVLRRDTLVLTKDAVEAVHARFEGRSLAASPFSKENFVDDIQLVDGIGPKSARELRKEGFDTLTSFVEKDPSAVLEKLGLTARAEREEWVAQCKEMIAGEPPRSKVDKEYAARLLAKRAKEGK